MKCPRCSKDYPRSERRCPHCDKLNPAAGVFQTSLVLVSVRGSGRIYRSVEELPARLRSRLHSSTNSENSATILIADRRGRSEIAKALRALPGAAERRLTRAILGETAAGPPKWLGRRSLRAKAVLAVLLGLALVAIAFVFRYGWR